MTEPSGRSELETVLATLHRTAAAMAADTRPPERIALSAAGVTLEWDLPRATAAPVVETPAVASPNSTLAGIPVPSTVTGQPPAAALPASSGGGVAAPAQHVLSAPTVGVFYRSPEPGAPPFVDTGDLVSPGQQVGIVEAMKLMIPVEADRGGRVVEVLCADSSSVEFGAPLFALAEA